jgi:hypothetical protein
MPVFVNEVVVRGTLREGAEEPAGAPEADPAARERLVAEVTRAVIARLEREMDRAAER